MQVDLLQRLRTPRVLIVDDEPRLRELLLDVVPDMGFEASAVRSAEEAGRTMNNDPAEIVILDLQLPLQGGMDFFGQLRQHWPDTQVIVITGFGDLDSAQRAIRLGVVDFITKPFHLNEIEVALDRAKKRLRTLIAKVDDDNPTATLQNDEAITLQEIEHQAIRAALERHHGNRTAAAAELGISRRKLHYWLSENDTGNGGSQ